MLFHFTKTISAVDLLIKKLFKFKNFNLRYLYNAKQKFIVLEM
jgi:hypothetical protein